MIKMTADLKNIGLLIGASDVTDADIFDFQCRHRALDLTKVDLSKTQITANAMPNLTVYTSIRYLDLCGRPIGDIGLWHLRMLTNMRNLSLSSCGITDEGLQNLNGMSSLLSLFIDNNTISYKAILQLLNSLAGGKDNLVLNHLKVTGFQPTEVQELRAKYPGLTVENFEPCTAETGAPTAVGHSNCC